MSLKRDQSRRRAARRSGQPLGGVIHTYQKYDPKRFPPPTGEPPDMVSGAFEHLLMYGNTRRFTEEQLANAIKLDPSQIKGLGPSLDALIAMLEERKRKILETYETDSVLKDAADHYRTVADHAQPPESLRKLFEREVREEQLSALEDLWYRAERNDPPFARDLLHIREALGEKYEVEELAAKYDFTGRESMSVPEAIDIKEQLETIDRLLEQLREAMENAQLAVVDMQELSEFASPEDMENLRGLQQQIEDYLKELAEQQGLEFTREGYQLGPKAYRIFQSRLLEEIFSDLQAARSGRHSGPIVGEGAVELPSTRPYDFGDSMAHIDVPQTIINAYARQNEWHQLPKDVKRRGIRPSLDDIEVHNTRNNPRCATCVIMDMSGSMHYDGQYVNCKRMALALDGLVRSEYPGDFLQFIEMYTVGKPRRVVEVPTLMPKPVSIYDPVVRLRADMSDPNITELDLPLHFTNIQHSLQLARQFLGHQDTPNRNIILITDGLPTAHFEDEQLLLLYPPDPRTEERTLREAHLCSNDGITINVFLLPNWSQTSEDVQFAHKMVEATGGRVFFTGGHDLDRYIVWDYVAGRRKIIG